MNSAGKSDEHYDEAEAKARMDALLRQAMKSPPKPKKQEKKKPAK